MKRELWLIGTLAAALAFCGVVLNLKPAAAATQVAGFFLVDRTDDSADLAAQGCDVAVANDCSLRGAVIKANANPGSTIVLGAGNIFTLTISGGGAATPAHTGDLNLTAPVTITTFCLALPCSNARIVGGAGWAEAIFSVDSGTARISRLTVSGGNTAFGGGIRVSSGSALTLTDSLLTRNIASLRGGGLYVETDGYAAMQDSALISNTAILGGGLAVDPGGRAQGHVMTITANTSTDNGGGIFADVGGWVELHDSEISRNTAGSNGGGIYTGNFVTLTIGASAVMSNAALSNGGGIYTGIYSTATLTATLIHGNHVTNTGGTGGGVYNNGLLHLRDSEVSGNTAAYAGGLNLGGPAVITASAIISNFAANYGGGLEVRNKLSMLNSTVSHNRAGGDGGGLYVFAGIYTATIESTTIVRNTANSDGGSIGTGGGIYRLSGGLRLLNTILALNTVPPAGLNHPDCDGSFTSLGYNLVGSLTGCAIGGDLTGNLTGVDPLLGELRDNGGPTWTHELLPGSPAIDAGPPILCPPADQRGVARPVNGTGLAGAVCDIGAYEYNSPTVRQLFLPLILR